MTKTTVMVEFIIHGDSFDLNDITHLLGIEPTKKRVKRLIPDGYTRASPCTSWILGTKSEESYDINDQLGLVIQQLNDKVDILKKIRKDYKIEIGFSIVIYIKNRETPAIYFETTTLKFIADIEAEIDIDTYVYS